MPAPTRASHRTGFGSSTSAIPRGYSTDWTVGPTTDLHYAGYAQDRWSPNDKLTLTLGIRMDYQKVGHGDAVRRPLITDGIFPAETNVAANTLVKNTNIAPRLGVTYDLTGKGRTVLKAFYGQYYNNIADSFTGANPAELHDRGVQLPRSEPQWRLRRAVGARYGAAAVRWQLDGASIPITRRRGPRRSAPRSRPSFRVNRRRA